MMNQQNGRRVRRRQQNERGTITAGRIPPIMLPVAERRNEFCRTALANSNSAAYLPNRASIHYADVCVLPPLCLATFELVSRVHNGFQAVPGQVTV